MIPEEYVTYETARLLKAAGFPQDKRCCLFYNKYGQDWHFADGYIGNGYAKPSQAQAMRWLREEKRIHSEIRYRIYKHNWDCLLRDMNGKVVIPQESLNYVRNLQDFWVTFSTYEAAAEACIMAACEYLIDKNKKQ